MPLPDTETTEAEPITVPDEDVFEEIPEDNPFRSILEDLRDEGHEWGEVFELLHTAFNPVDSAAYEESNVRIPIYEIEAVVHDEQATSGERYETFERPEPTEDEAIEWVRSKPEVRRIESTERVGTVKIG